MALAPSPKIAVMPALAALLLILGEPALLAAGESAEPGSATIARHSAFWQAASNASTSRWVTKWNRSGFPVTWHFWSSNG